MSLRKDIVSYDQTIVEVNGWLKKKEYAFPHAKIDNGWIGLLMKEFDRILQTIKVLITSWGTFLTSMFQNVIEAHKLKENKAKAVSHKRACHSEKHNILE